MNALQRRTRLILAAWAALLALMLASLGSAYLPLGSGNLVAGLAIATAKSLLVLGLFMGLVRAPATLRLAAGLGFATLALLFALSTVDYATREVRPAPLQPPTQLAPTGHSAAPALPSVAPALPSVAPALPSVIPAKAGIQGVRLLPVLAGKRKPWIPAFAGMTTRKRASSPQRKIAWLAGKPWIPAFAGMTVCGQASSPQGKIA